jgi:hypothetical protein
MIKHHLETDMLKDSNISTDDARALFKQGAPLVETSGWGKIN